MLTKLKHQIILLVIIIFLTILLFTMCKPDNTTDIVLIPQPQELNLSSGNFEFSTSTNIESKFSHLNEYLKGEIDRFAGINLGNSEKSFTNLIHFKIDSTLTSEESYSLSISEKNITITGATEKGIFWGIQTILQMIPKDSESVKDKKFSIPALEIKDESAFPWRGLNLDCSRHFMEKDFIKRYIDILAYYKFNTFHWHLTEDQGWRLEIEKYPKLTEIGAWRKESEDSIYGGYYTKEDVKEIVDYANARYINIVPEIEMPGHSLASLAAYPENSCTGGPFEVTNVWGVHKDIYCAGKEETFLFLQDILDEVIEMFPGKYIHIGGDEAPKDRWEKCNDCQARIKSEGLKDEHELQSYFIKRMVNYLHSKGKEVIGWEEIIQGGLTPGVIVQSWLTYESAIEAAKQGHYVIFSPTSHTYFDYDPSDFDLENVYSFNPILDGLTGDETKLIIGSEGNMWTERAPQETIDSKLFPRMLALAEVLWKNPNPKNRKVSYKEFYSRIQRHYSDMTARGIKYGRESKVFVPVIEYDKVNKEFSVKVKQGQKDVLVKYTLDGSNPTKTSKDYSKIIKINTTTLLKIAAIKDDQIIGEIVELPFEFHKGLDANLTLENKYHQKYKASGNISLINGVRGTSNFKDSNWQGYEGVDVVATIDLGSQQEISKIETNFFFDSNSWVFLPDNVKISLSLDGKRFNNEIVINHDIPLKTSDTLVKNFAANYDNQKARYIRLVGENIKTCPEWHPGNGYPAWLFIDEILVY